MTPAAPAQQVRNLLTALNMNEPSDLDLARVAEHYNIEIREAHLDGCAANIIGVGDQAIVTVDQTSTPGRKRYSAAHEIAHWIYDRGKGLYLCSSRDLNIPWNSRAKAKAIEKRANRFAAELLMPRLWFREAARNIPPSFDAVETLRRAFKTSRSSTAIRLIELGATLGILMMFDKIGRRKWYCGSAELPDRFYPHQSISRRSHAWRQIALEHRVRSDICEVDGDLWIDHPRAFDFSLFEQAIQVGSNILVMAWFADDHVVSEIVESDEELSQP